VYRYIRIYVLTFIFVKDRCYERIGDTNYSISRARTCQCVIAIPSLYLLLGRDGTFPSNLKNPVTRTNGPRGRDQSALPSRELFFREVRLSARFPCACVRTVLLTGTLKNKRKMRRPRQRRILPWTVLLSASLCTFIIS